MQLSKTNIEIIRQCKIRRAVHIHKTVKAKYDSLLSFNIIQFQIDREIKNHFSIGKLKELPAEEIDNCIAFIKSFKYCYNGEWLR